MFLKFIGISILTIAVFASPALAQRSSGEADKSSRDVNRYSDRDRSKAWNSEKDKLEQALKPGQDKNSYRQQLEKMGYKITATNYDKADYVEYEVVKDDETFEVQIEMKQGKATEIDVATNMWQAEATERALKDGGRGSSAAQKGAR